MLLLKILYNLELLLILKSKQNTDINSQLCPTIAIHEFNKTLPTCRAANMIKILK